ncbi:hypothetical protein KBD20_04630 [Candidatus Saccharibacteria bacterium]|nr:hypothetical protein [Candidatus Saccharibacteria bacterium]
MSEREIIVTAGGTREPIDDVRYVGNFSGGRFGLAIAEAFADQVGQLGHIIDGPEPNITLIAPKETIERFGLPSGVRHESFTNAESLQKALLGRRETPDIIVQAAAVADFSPQKLDGKVSSNVESMTVNMLRVPKILPELRKKYGEIPYIIGFKLLSNVAERDLIEVGRKQLIDNRLDLTVANSLQEIRPLGRRVIALAKGREDYVIEGSTKNVASRLVTYILTRSAQKESDRLASIPKEPI